MALEAHISLTTRDTYKKRLKDHLKETKAQAKGLERRIKKLGGKVEAGPLPEVCLRCRPRAPRRRSPPPRGPCTRSAGTSEPEKMLKNAKTEFSEEHEEIANYNAIETLAEAVGDKETAKLAREYPPPGGADGQVPRPHDRVAHQGGGAREIPAAERNGGRRRRHRPQAPHRPQARHHHDAQAVRTARKRSTTRKRTTARRK